LVVGQVSITKRVKSSKWGIAFWISHEYQKRGYAKEAVVALTERLRTENGLRFFAGASLWNEASNKVLIDSGFRKVRTHQNGYMYNGKTISEAMNEYEKV
jgi:RimJ/RimL family protein N-acetyltransferase